MASKSNHVELIFGRNAVLQALRAGTDIRRILLARGTKRKGVLAEALGKAKRAQVPGVQVERDGLERMLRPHALRGWLHQGTIAEAGEFSWVESDDSLA